jgi:hypothetical protein
MPSGTCVKRESYTRTKKISMIWFVGGSMRILKTNSLYSFQTPVLSKEEQGDLLVQAHCE